jgi:hypothetical protein
MSVEPRPVLFLAFNQKHAHTVAHAWGVDPRMFRYVRNERDLMGIPRGTPLVTYFPPGFFPSRVQSDALVVAHARGLTIEEFEDLYTPEKTATQAFANVLFNDGVGVGPDPVIDRIQRRVDEAEARILASVGLQAPEIDLDARRTEAWKEHFRTVIKQHYAERNAR